MTAVEILEKYISFFEKQGHTRIENSSLVPLNDPTTLFTSSGMQPLVQFLLGEEHPQGKRLVNVQNCFRAQDIDEIGDNRHTTFFRMLGNWSLGDYFKAEQIPWFWEFLTNKQKGLGLSPDKLYVSVFEGWEKIPKDIESAKIWKEIFEKAGLNSEERISYYGVDKNWWSRSGVPENMPAGEPGGPDTEVFYDFGTPHDKKFGQKCDPNCQCGRFLEIGNSVFMQYQKQEDGSFKNLPKQNVDFGGGLERLVAATEDKQDIFQTSLFSPIIKFIEELSKSDYKTNNRAMRIITDHIIASVFIASNDVFPSNKDQGYVLRRLLRRAIRYGKQIGINSHFTAEIAYKVIANYANTDPQLEKKKELVKRVFSDEEEKFSRVIQEGLKQSEKILEKCTPIDETNYARIMQIPNKNEMFRNIYRGQGVPNMHEYGITITPSQIANGTVTGKDAFNLYQSFGFPLEMIVDLAQEKRLFVDIESSRDEIKQHQDISRKGAAQKFSGGLADSSEKTIMGHTATHLLQQALRDILGNTVFQTGSNITAERIRFDFSYDKKLTEDAIRKAEEIVNQKIAENLPVHFEMMPVVKAKSLGAIGLFDEKYAENVKVYFIGEYSKELCGGPHVDFTGSLKGFKIIKEEGLGKGNRRIYANVGDN